MSQMESKESYLHIIAFDIPLPANYGGAIDIYYKIRALHQLGVRIHLHCFQYGRPQSSELELYCDSVSYYPRRRGILPLLSSRPFIVASRSNRRLLKALLNDQHPILFEGLHTTALLCDKRLSDRWKIVRTHNIEHHYYQGLARSEINPVRRLYFRMEAKKLQRWEQVLRCANAVAAISMKDENHLKDLSSLIRTISAFHPDTEVDAVKGMGQYALYHGSLDVSENQKAALWLVQEVFSGLNIPLVIAGNKAPAHLRKAVEASEMVTLREGLSSSEIAELVAGAQVNVLPTFQATGVKLKLLAALHRGRHCLVNSPMVEQTGLEPLCYVENDVISFRTRLIELMDKPFDAEELEHRRKLLDEGIFSNRRNAEELLSLIYRGGRS
jgi:hypothetical protein